MKNNKGFTLIELLGIIVILVAIFLVAFPSLLGTTKQDEEKLYTSMVDDLCLAGETYIYSNIDNFPELSTPNSKINIKISTLIKDGNVSKDKTNPKTGEKINSHILEFTVLEDNSLQCKYSDDFVLLSQYITDLYNNSTKTDSLEVDYTVYKLDTINQLMNDRLGLSATGDYEGNIRYYGANPNNYIDIGDRDSSGNVIFWRIIGVFETKYATDELTCDIDSDSDGHYDNCATDKLVKIIRNDLIANMEWDNNNRNDWSTSTLSTYLNTSTYYPNLNSNVTRKIENVLWNLGGDTETLSNYAGDWYRAERDTDIYTEWLGKIGLMYPSDYGYAADLSQCNLTLSQYDSSVLCINTNWLYDLLDYYEWTLAHDSSNSTEVFANQGSIFGIDAATTDGGVRPVLYLKADTVLTGTATTSDGITYYVVE